MLDAQIKRKKMVDKSTVPDKDNQPSGNTYIAMTSYSTRKMQINYIYIYSIYIF
jgi:hypothetical protein